MEDDDSDLDDQDEEVLLQLLTGTVGAVETLCQESVPLMTNIVNAL